MIDVEKMQATVELAKMVNTITPVRLTEEDGKITLHIEFSPPPEAYLIMRNAIEAIVLNFASYAVNVMHNVSEAAIDGK
jgi:hypothetical protein